MSAISRLGTLSTIRRGMNLLTSQKIISRAIATSPKKTTTASEIEPVEKKKRWVSYGFDSTDQQRDYMRMHEVFFFAITIGTVFTGYVLLFKPDTLSMHDWAHREAYLQLRYREEHGLPLIDPNYIDPAKVVLPTDEELGDTEIII